MAREKVEGFLRCVADPWRGWVPLLICPRCPGYRCLQDKTVSSDRGWWTGQQKVQEIYGPYFWEKLEGEVRGSEDSTGFPQDACGCASVASDNGESRI